MIYQRREIASQAFSQLELHIRNSMHWIAKDYETTIEPIELRVVRAAKTSHC